MFQSDSPPTYVGHLQLIVWGQNRIDKDDNGGFHCPATKSHLEDLAWNMGYLPYPSLLDVCPRSHSVLGCSIKDPA